MIESTKISEHFDLREFVPPVIYNVYRQKSIMFLDKRIIYIAELLRQKLKTPIIINNWMHGGIYNHSGFRQSDCSEGAKNSAHKRGCAIDIKSRFSPKGMLSIVLNHKEEFIELGLSTIETLKKTPTWLHLSCQWGQNEKDITFF